MKEKQKKLSLRDLFHILGSKHQVSLLGVGMIGECLGNLIDKRDVPLEYAETIKKAISDLQIIKKANKESDTLLNEIKDTVYKKLNPDKITVSESRDVEFKEKN